MRTRLTGRLSLLFLSFAMMLALPAMALADTLQINNTLVVGSNVAKDPGQSGTGKVWLATDDNQTDTRNGCNATATAPVTVTFTSTDTSKIANPASVRLTDCGTDHAANFSYNVASSATAGTVQIKGAVSGGRGGTYTTTDTLAVTINAPAKQDTGISNVSGAGTYGGDANLTAKLSSGTNNLSGKSVAFEINGQAVGTDATDANGVAELGGVSLSGIDAGTHTGAVSANFVGDSGYNGSGGSGSLSVAKANAVIDVRGFDGAYDGNAKGASGTATGVGGADLSGLLDLGTKFTNVPGGTADWSFAGDANHKAASGSVAISIDKASSNTEVSCPASRIYTGQPLAPCTVSVTGAGGLSLSPAADYSNNTKAGTAAASYTYAGSANHLGSSDSKTFTIEKAEAVIKVDGFNGTYDGKAHGANGTATGVDGSNLNSLLDLGASFTNVPGGTADWSFAGDANHKAASGSVAISIDKAATTTKVECGVGPFTYNGSAQEPCSASVSGPGGLDQALTVDYRGNVNAGQATASASYAGSGNYEPSNDSKTFRIDKAIAQVALGNLGPHDYDGAAKAAAVSTDPAGLNVDVTYNGSATAPTAVGSYNVVATVNEANYRGSANGTLVVRPWTFKGFYQPVDMSGTLNTVKGGSTVPIKFELFKGATELTDTASINQPLRATKVACDTGVTVDEIELLATGATALRYDATGGQFVYNWKTPTGAGTCYKVTITANDGSSQTASFKIK